MSLYIPCAGYFKLLTSKKYSEVRAPKVPSLLFVWQRLQRSAISAKRSAPAAASPGKSVIPPDELEVELDELGVPPVELLEDELEEELEELLEELELGEPFIRNVPR